jgi:hypothetical protein
MEPVKKNKKLHPTRTTLVSANHPNNNNTYYFYGYSSSGVATGNCGAYDNFDCINECLEDEQLQQHNDEDDDEINSEDSNSLDSDEKCCFVTSNLVEDGFIRMSSPVDPIITSSSSSTNHRLRHQHNKDSSENDDENNNNIKTAGISEDVNIKDPAMISNGSVFIAMEASAFKLSGSSTVNGGGGGLEIGDRNSQLFPNVGSSPVMHEHEPNVEGDSSSDEEDQAEVDPDQTFDGIVMINGLSETRYIGGN